MKKYHVSGKTLSSAYHSALIVLRNEGAETECSDWNTDCVECAIDICVQEPMVEPMISKCFIGGPRELQQYTMEMVNGILDFEADAGKWNYTYHDRMANYICQYDQIGFVIDELKRNPNSRRAVIMVRDASDIGSSDPACLQHIQYLIRDGKLECFALFRSNDACKASFMNMFALIWLQKNIADKIGVPVGSYHHSANSYHCYKKDWDMLKAYVSRIVRDEEACSANYRGDWAEMMDDETAGILADVEELKKR